MVGYKKYFIEEYGSDGEKIYSSIRNQMDSIMQICYKSIENIINAEKNAVSFQLLGFDFIVDDKFKVFLLEINTNPGMTYNPIEQPFKEFLFPRLIEELFQLTIDQYYFDYRKLLPTDSIWISGISDITIINSPRITRRR